jgi:hypothetical protein
MGVGEREGEVWWRRGAARRRIVNVECAAFEGRHKRASLPGYDKVASEGLDNLNFLRNTGFDSEYTVMLGR